MQGRRALAAILASAALSGCGEQAQVEPARIQIEQTPPVATAGPDKARPAAARSRRRSRSPRAGRTASGTFRTAPTVPVPAAVPAANAQQRPVPKPRGRRTRPDYARFRAAQLEVLRAHCARRPEDEPRCRGTEVDEQVAFAAFEAAR